MRPLWHATLAAALVRTLIGMTVPFILAVFGFPSGQLQVAVKTTSRRP